VGADGRACASPRTVGGRSSLPVSGVRESEGESSRSPAPSCGVGALGPSIGPRRRLQVLLARRRARGTSRHPPLLASGYADPPKQQGGPVGARAPVEAKCNREKTSRWAPSGGQVMGESRDQDPGAVRGDAAAQANAGGCNCVRQAVADGHRPSGRDRWHLVQNRGRTQQSAISGMNCRISPLLNL
jgi:hypothetical protein